MVLAILTDVGFGRQCQVTEDNKEIYLEDAEALEFLWKKDDKSTEEVDGHDDDRDKSENQIFVSAEFILCRDFHIWMGQTSQECRWEEEEEDEGLLLACTQF